VSNIQTVFVAALLVGLAGCATAKPDTFVNFGCAPEGYETLSTDWKIESQQEGMATVTEDGKPIPILMVVMRNIKANRAIVLMFVNKHTELAILDPAPEDKGVSILGNRRFINDENELRPDGVGACSWRPLISTDKAA